MSRRSDLHGVLRGLKTVGKEIAVNKKAKIETAVKGTPLELPFGTLVRSVKDGVRSAKATGSFAGVTASVRSANPKSGPKQPDQRRVAEKTNIESKGSSAKKNFPVNRLPIMENVIHPRADPPPIDSAGLITDKFKTGLR